MAGGTDKEFTDLSAPLLSNSGDAVFTANYFDRDGDSFGAPFGQGLWRVDGEGNTELIAQAGSPAPGTGDGVVFESQFLNKTMLATNAHGQVAFYGLAEDTTKTELNEISGLWAEDANRHLKLVVKVGDLLNVSDDPDKPDLREVVQVFFQAPSNGNDGYGSSFNDRGQITFQAFFKDGSSGAFVSNVAAVPEPSLLFLAVSAGLCMATIRFRPERGRQREKGS